ncbi:tRNA (adenosine(37)-N6)-threonylcarbamoyltransferase complex ATPase subunit type 1 TsaE [Rhizobium skierniewicense]|uniref:tRNA (adenosine(37)-N6)-threonylcarbamoyltransferase complex ATPase subunit type 1 TsaE n=1 Tax=Rhizobium skierniewicense TaxID=984260 RepID=UPI0015744254|nr:tRNA (adenosine(37)-N6)-threonylcarbamoyltransferase complex ATPase subunit type 1 TsaE [Rhizobium skierniewicense]NTF33383.1 tRNA (adenosine(37)-N6)-threonylcarbamoyltransferase complex ATPase subunit type 1 TsaE [Rhizobium skierniewicense]
MSETVLPLSIGLADEAETIRLGQALALTVKPGDCIALIGDLGAGKSTLARALIRAVAGDPYHEVPSPTFTIVQSYGLRFPVHHLDLYRLSDVSEMDELGIDEMLSDGVCLIEWPELAASELPDDSTITLRLTHHGDGRMATIDAPQRLRTRLDRVLAIGHFLKRNGRENAVRHYFSGDAAYRTYELISDNDSQNLLMDWQPPPRGPVIQDGKTYAEIVHLARDVRPFVAIDSFLSQNGFSVPAILAQDLEEGILLLEDIGRDGVLDADGNPIAERYLESVACLAALHEAALPGDIALPDGTIYQVPSFDADAMKIETSLLLDWYVPHIRGEDISGDEKQSFFAIWDQLIEKLGDAETGLLLRDFHSPNVIWQTQKTGINQVGIIDFQDAMIGPTAYDLASIVQDARVTIPSDLQARLMGHYLDIRRKSPDFDEAAFLKAFAIMAAQRNCKLVGIWVRLMKRDGKPHYMKHMPRTFSYLRSALEHPDLAPLNDWFRNAHIDIHEQRNFS